MLKIKDYGNYEVIFLGKNDISDYYSVYEWNNVEDMVTNSDCHCLVRLRQNILTELNLDINATNLGDTNLDYEFCKNAVEKKVKIYGLKKDYSEKIASDLLDNLYSIGKKL